MIERHTLIDQVLKDHRSDLNVDFDKYRHHVYRVYNFVLLLHEEDEQVDTDTLAIAAAFHDIGIWTNGTFDYIGPSVARAREYIKSKKLKLSADAVEEIIANHHKFTKYSDNKLAECFRKADLIDLSLGIISHGVSHRDILELYQIFPESNFHIFILKEAAIHTFKNPFNPLPFFKW